MSECLEYAVVTFQDHGVWGGKTRDELRELRRERRLVHPSIPSYLKQQEGSG